jgi:DNA polymerase
MTLLNVIDRYRNCTACPLHETAHEKVFFRGCVPCEVLFIGEAPGNDEDLYGEPFIGRAGKTLDSLILESSEETKPYTFGISGY